MEISTSENIKNMSIKIIRIDSLKENISLIEKFQFEYLDKLVKLYQNTFRASPYFEDFTFEESKKEILSYLNIYNGGILLLAINNDNEPIGFLGATIGKSFLSLNILNRMLRWNRVLTDYYISNTIVDKNFRRKVVQN